MLSNFFEEFRFPTDVNYRIWIEEFVFSSNGISQKELEEMDSEEYHFKLLLALRNMSYHIQRAKASTSMGI